LKSYRLEIGNPKAVFGPVVGILGEKMRRISPGLIDVLKDDQRLCNRLAIVDKYRDLFVDRVVLEELLTFVVKILFYVFIIYALYLEG